ncbi:thioredoxin family protein [Blastopirellula retiformator]|uniref:thioredoxin family protein n=1 Tax=Blastopirellula retiformator TaxID=2527970 RepID=UPI0016445B43|nr:thioredoxin family protein [Blastopirellula retiformator]
MPKSALAPRFTPKGAAVALTPGDQEGLPGVDHLVGRIELGPQEMRGEGLLICISRSEAGKPYDTLLVDLNQDGKLNDKAPATTTPNILRGKIWSSFTEVTLPVRHTAGEDGLVDYPVSLWVVVADEAETPDAIRFTRTGFLQGEIKIDDQKYQVVVADANNDGIIAKYDSWAICLVSDDAKAEPPIWRRMSEFTWGGEKAWHIWMNGTDGSSGEILPHDPGITRQEDIENRDFMRVDRMAKQAKEPVPFETDCEVAIKKAADAGKPCFVKFETTWCLPCKQMDAYVFTAQDVVNAVEAEGVVCVKVDGDKHRDLADKLKVTGYPTGILLDPSGEETARYTGYRSVKQMTAFFQTAGE